MFKFKFTEFAGVNFKLIWNIFNFVPLKAVNFVLIMIILQRFDKITELHFKNNRKSQRDHLISSSLFGDKLHTG